MAAEKISSLGHEDINSDLVKLSKEERAEIQVRPVRTVDVPASAYASQAASNDVSDIIVTAQNAVYYPDSSDAVLMQVGGIGGGASIPYLTSVHSTILNRARLHPADPNAKGWSLGDIGGEWLHDKFGIFDPNKGEFKNNMVVWNKDAVNDASKFYDLPPELLGSVLWREVGANWVADEYGMTFRSPHGGGRMPWTDKPWDQTSIGPMNIQIRRGVTTLGYDPKNTSRQQLAQIMATLENPTTAIYVAAKHLSDLRNQDFRGVSASDLTRHQLEIVATRYNVGPQASLPYIERNIDIGQTTLRSWNLVHKLLK